MLSRLCVFGVIFFIFQTNIWVACKEDSGNGKQDNIQNLVTSLIKSSIHESVLNSTYKVREKLRKALTFVETAIDHALNCTNCIENFLGVGVGGNNTKCEGKDCDKGELEDIDNDIADLPLISRVVSIKELNDDNNSDNDKLKPAKKHHKKTHRQHPKNVQPKKEQVVPSTTPQTPSHVTTPIAEMNSMAPQNTSPTQDSYSGPDGQCLPPCSPVCAPQCSYQCCQANTISPIQSQNTMNPPMPMNQSTCPASCMSQCQSFCPQHCCRSKINKSSKRSHTRMLIDHA